MVPAESSVVVPITVTRVAPQSLSISDGGTTLTAKVVVPNPVELRYRLDALRGLLQHGHRGHARAAPGADGDARRQPGAFLSLDPALAGLGYDSNTTPAGFSQTVQFLASGATPGMLEPGESVHVPVYYGGWLSSQWNSSAAGHLQPQRGRHDQHADHRLELVRGAGLQLGSINQAAWNAISRS